MLVVFHDEREPEVVYAAMDLRGAIQLRHLPSPQMTIVIIQLSAVYLPFMTVPANGAEVVHLTRMHFISCFYLLFKLTNLKFAVFYWYAQRKLASGKKCLRVYKSAADSAPSQRRAILSRTGVMKALEGRPVAGSSNISHRSLQRVGLRSGRTT